MKQHLYQLIIIGSTLCVSPKIDCSQTNADQFKKHLESLPSDIVINVIFKTNADIAVLEQAIFDTHEPRGKIVTALRLLSLPEKYAQLLRARSKRTKEFIKEYVCDLELAILKGATVADAFKQHALRLWPNIIQRHLFKTERWIDFAIMSKVSDIDDSFEKTTLINLPQSDDKIDIIKWYSDPNKNNENYVEEMQYAAQLTAIEQDRIRLMRVYRWRDNIAQLKQHAIYKDMVECYYACPDSDAIILHCKDNSYWRIQKASLQNVQEKIAAARVDPFPKFESVLESMKQSNNYKKACPQNLLGNYAQ